ncbi:hypothetical protein [Clostridium butyricum]|jgi:GTP1/Obg family GTP-binding protein|uniref:hypothetical protein n=1 Tax=Clostridium butyricum TaxID=1492 RepID=UPI0003FD70A4|nr:hypothetical protein [Clostridium butyricum]MCQ2017251.1 hypothetical protein [Clostridium butyricum]MCQ2021124.1 hypothetical protein [Clostridium butyricum]UTY53608.1 hypothetical protein HNS01_11080 [Clostridium butyricum]
MSKIKDPEWEFIFENEPDQETLNDFHKSLAEILVNKYGAKNMKIILEEIKKQES